MVVKKEKNLPQEELPENTVNSKVKFSIGRVAELLRKMEKLLGIPLSLRSTSGEVVCKTDYFYGPCSFIRGTDSGCERCRKVYKRIENRVIKRKVSYVCLCYCGFLIFAVPLEFRGEMVGTLIGSQILPVSEGNTVSEFRKNFVQKAKELGLEATEEFNNSFSKVKTLDSEKQRPKFLSYLEEIAQYFVEMAIADKPWNVLLKEIKKKAPEFGKF
jgi:ligand-binding sensor protein